MPRKPRIHVPGSFYHGIVRGNAGDPLFLDDISPAPLLQASS
jgi:hypothetical protein